VVAGGTGVTRAILKECDPADSVHPERYRRHHHNNKPEPVYEENPMTTRHPKKKHHAKADEPAQHSEPPQEATSAGQSGAAEAPAQAPAQPPEATLAEKIGGENAIANAVEILTRKLGSDPRINYFLYGLSESERGEKHRTFLTMILGGPDEEVGDDLRRAFAQLADKGLKDRQVDVILDHLRNTLQEMDVAEEFAEEVVSTASSLRDNLLGR
jgi:hemoglobin